MQLNVGYESTYLRTRAHRRRICPSRRRLALPGCLCVAALPDSARVGLGRDRRHHRGESWLRRPDRAQRHRGLQRPRAGLSATPLLAAPYHPRRLRYGAGRPPPSLAPPEPAHLRPANQPLDVGVSRRGQLRPGFDRCAGDRRDHPRHLSPPGCALETGEKLDHLARSPLHLKKGARDRLIRLLSTHPAWALGFQDETWWSRTARPALHAWTPDDEPLRLIEQTVSDDDPDPPALACYGLLVRDAAASEQTWLRFVEGRPLS